MHTLVLVCGSLRWVDPQPVEARLAEVYERVGRDNMTVIHADDQPGPPRIAADWCNRWHVAQRRVRADYDRHGFEAWRFRNEDMLDRLVEARRRGVHVEMAVFRLPDDGRASDLDALVDAARDLGIPGTLVRATATAA
jgi:hypothetical protein